MQPCAVWSCRSGSAGHIELRRSWTSTSLRPRACSGNMTTPRSGSENVSYWSRTYEGVPEQLSAVRQYTRDVLGDGPGVDDVVLVVSELAANAIRHTLSGEPDGVFVLHVADL